jgi:hypothetical protein
MKPSNPEASVTKASKALEITQVIASQCNII